jgi:hypothetical protein
VEHVQDLDRTGMVPGLALEPAYSLDSWRSAQFRYPSVTEGHPSLQSSISCLLPSACGPVEPNYYYCAIEEI